MHLVAAVECLIICGLLYMVSCAPSTPAAHVSSTPIASSTTPKPKEQTTPPNTTAQTDTTLEIISDLADHHSTGPRFLADTVTDGDLSDNEAYYVGAVLLANAFVFFSVIFYLLTPWTRVCSWFGNCKHINANGQGYYPLGLGHSLDDAARMMTTFNMNDFRAKRSSEYVEPLLKFLSDAYDKYDSDPSANEKANLLATKARTA